MSRIVSGHLRAAIVCALSVCFLAAPARAQHTADLNGDFSITLSELLRVIQFYNSLSLHCQAGTEDGYAPGNGDHSCAPHDSDYSPQDWQISLSELLRIVQFYNSNGGYQDCVDGEDGFCPILIPEGEGEGEGEGAAEGEGEGEGEGTAEGEGEGEGEGEPVPGFVVLTIGAVDASPGDHVNVPLTITASDASPSLLSFDLNFNDIRLTYTGASVGSVLTGRSFSAMNQGGGVIHFTVNNPQALETPIANGVFATLGFDISYDTAYGQTYPIFGSSATCFGTDALPIDLTLANGAVNMHATGPVAPHADFSASPLISLIDAPIDFVDDSFLGTGNTVTWAWSFGDGSISTQQNPSHAYSATGTYNVTLIVNTSDGSDAEVKQGYVQIIDGKRIYVNKASTAPIQNGFTWGTAFNTLQKGIDAVNAAGGGEVWVAQGTYNEARGASSGVLNMRNLVTLYGGFVGTETDEAQRDPVAHATIIDGSVARNGEPAIHVIIGADNTVIDGFTIKGGRATSTATTTDSQGGGIFNLGVSTTLTNCTFDNNQARTTGGAIFTSGGSIQILNCTFTNNSVSNTAGANANATAFGGAVYNTDTTATITGCTFTTNNAAATGTWTTGAGITAQALGGGLYCFNSTTTIDGCVFGGNTVAGTGSGSGKFNSNDVAAAPIARGGGLYLRAGSNYVTRTIIAGNGASSSGNNNFANASGAGAFFEAATVTMTNSLVNLNQTTNPGTDEAGSGLAIDNTLGQRAVIVSNCDIVQNSSNTNDLTSIAGLLTVNAAPTITNCIVYFNTGVGLLSLGGAANATYCDFQDAVAGTGNISADPAFVNLNGHDYHLTINSPCVDTGRSTAGGGFGGVTVDGEGNARGFNASPVVNADGSNYDMGAFEFVQ